MLLVAVTTMVANRVSDTLLRPYSYEVWVVWDAALAAALGAFEGVIAAVLYHDLQVAKEGIAVERLAAVFE